MPGPAARAARFPALDGLRAVGALAVLTTHVGFSSGASLAGPWSGLLARLDVGVALFFVVSGFLLYRPHVAARLDGVARPATPTYLWHRALRILPALWIAVALAWLTLGSSRQDASGFLQVATLTQIYLDGFEVPGLTQMWSLSTEVAFYLVLPLLASGLAAAVRRAGGPTTAGLRLELAGLALLAGVGVVWWLAVVGSAPGLGLWLPGYLTWFAAGMALAVWNAARERDLLGPGPLDTLAGAPGTAWACALALFVLAMTPVAGPYGLDVPTSGTALTKNLLYAVVGALVVLPAVAPSATPSRAALDRVLGTGVPRFLGQVSYGVFAYHVALLHLAERAVGHVPFGGQFWILWVLTLGGALLAATLSFYGVERPVLRWGRRHEPTRASTAKATRTLA